MTPTESAGPATEHGSILDLIRGTPVGAALDTPLPSTPLEALQDSPLGPFLDMPLGELPPLPPLPAPPPLPPNPVEALLQGQALSGLPGVDELFRPLTDLAGSFGTGTFGAFDPTALLDMSSGMLDQAMSMSLSGLKVLDQIWQSQAAQAAQTQGLQAQTSGTELSERGTEISTTTQTAAASVARGNANLMTISESFAATAVAAAPMVLTPPGQAMLLASAAEHLKAAIGVVAQTRTELNEQTLTMNGLAAPVPVPPPPAPGAVAGAVPPSPFAIASTVIEEVGKPMISTVTASVGDLVSASTQAASASPGDLPTDAVAAKSAVAPAHGPAGGVPGAVGLAGGAGIGMFGSGTGGSASASGGSVPRGTVGAVAPPAAVSPVSPTSTLTPAPPTSPGGAMGGVAGAGRGGDEQLSGRSTPSYLVNAGENNAFAGDLPMVAPAVIGGEELDDIPFGDRT
ncbi:MULTISPECIES: hypothetical protein [unclassified Rhodococcus (in: high G+C Gram-positive bacteria)]|uniref:hypothetical protein n=1 Tax=unclassified Rhodococcus (in: high G+C Gram-positive bacteria) TaxID=192944 RepID=UPI001639AACC|nr:MULTISPECIES: hypothetical protein [unclassified Rhodococcus (in: high G+C Gram-positive bacteria)]MBC2644003.1 hypothetical protein [Rhodococcus sp. 3A]MBC2891258.1 hypothetical protein [Rhodococcus sp. 4CII]